MSPLSLDCLQQPRSFAPLATEIGLPCSAKERSGELLLESLVHEAHFHISKATYSDCLFRREEEHLMLKRYLGMDRCMATVEGEHMGADEGRTERDAPR